MGERPLQASLVGLHNAWKKAVLEAKSEIEKAKALAAFASRWVKSRASADGKKLAALEKKLEATLKKAARKAAAKAKAAPKKMAAAKKKAAPKKKAAAKKKAAPKKKAAAKKKK